MKKRFTRFKHTVIAALSAAALVAPSLPASAAANYKLYTVGSTTNVSPTTTFGQVMMGGSTDVDEAFKWMIEKANGGDFLIIRATGTDAYNQYVYDLAQSIGKPLNSVSTLIVTNLNNAGSDSAVIDKINKAEAIFFAGGNQADYVNFLEGTPALTALNNRIQNIPFGGTSAGTMIQGDHIYDSISAGSTTLDSTTALNNPYNSLISFTDYLIQTPVNHNIQTDTHFEQRDRMGRFLTFIARNIQDGEETAATAKGIAVNEKSALLIEKDGTAKVVTQPGAVNPGVYMAKSNEAPLVCQSGSPLTFRNISVYKLFHGSTFNLTTWTGNGGLPYTLNVNNGVITSSTGNVYGGNTP
ncbi:cyanophycinase [Ectobacillus antri]|jgi:cyanophycinase|uniref:Cyanophycinase n=1 Tax=Ectobacillus antri TaxID=2486280 RepID=A0ABT6H6T7_9BACI|nr:cyanophycinase [Ectobacillus antri]MDG4657331.1 cyanophycinase [Ectobacillus antri]MDG5754538.1 cyanophycinase [Ectobacillus antri]